MSRASSKRWSVVQVFEAGYLQFNIIYDDTFIYIDKEEKKYDFHPRARAELRVLGLK